VELDLWEGAKACACLRRADLLESIALGDMGKEKSMPHDWKRRQIFEQIIREVGTYTRLAGQVVKLNQEYEHLREFLSKMEEKFSKELKILCSEKARALLAEHITRFRIQKQSVSPKKAELWRAHINWAPGAFDLRYRAVLERERDLDAAFQVRVAAILRVYLSKESGISLRTISRLVVLVYLSAGLAGDRHDEAIICNGGRRLEIRNVEQRLRRAGLDRLFDYYEE